MYEFRVQIHSKSLEIPPHQQCVIYKIEQKHTILTLVKKSLFKFKYKRIPIKYYVLEYFYNVKYMSDWFNTIEYL